MMKDLEIWITRLVYLRYSVHLPSLSIYQTGLSKYPIETKNNQDKFVENELSQKWLNLLKMVPILSKVNPILNDVMISTEHVQIRDLITYVCAFYEWWRIWRDLEREILWMWILWMMKDLEIWITRLVYLVYARYSVHLPSLSIYQTGLSLSEGITINIISKQKIIKTSSWRMNYRKNELIY